MAGHTAANRYGSDAPAIGTLTTAIALLGTLAALMAGWLVALWPPVYAAAAGFGWDKGRPAESSVGWRRGIVASVTLAFLGIGVGMTWQWWYPAAALGLSVCLLVGFHLFDLARDEVVVSPTTTSTQQVAVEEPPAEAPPPQELAADDRGAEETPVIAEEQHPDDADEEKLPDQGSGSLPVSRNP